MTDNKNNKESICGLLISFAKSQPKINSLYKGCDPEEGNLAYYFLTDNIKVDFKLDELITRLDIKIARKYDCFCRLMSIPGNPESVKNYGFLKKQIYNRD